MDLEETFSGYNLFVFSISDAYFVPFFFSDGFQLSYNFYLPEEYWILENLEIQELNATVTLTVDYQFFKQDFIFFLTFNYYIFYPILGNDFYWNYFQLSGEGNVFHRLIKAVSEMKYLLNCLFYFFSTI